MAVWIFVLIDLGEVKQFMGKVGFESHFYYFCLSLVANTMLQLNDIPRKSPSIIARRAGDEYVLVPVTDNIADMTGMYTLNETGAFIWDRIDGVASAGDIADALAAEYGEDAGTTRRDVLECLAGLKQYNIITT